MKEKNDNRIEWIDNSKAFAIFCVVFGHIEYFSLDHYDGFFHRAQSLFIMPLFFFLSGMFAKPQYSLRDTMLCVKKKALQLLIPFIFCGSIYVFLCSHRPWWSLFWYPKGEGHMGYWFLLVLFEMFVLFSACQFLTRKLKIGSLTGFGFLLVAFVVWILLTAISAFKVLSSNDAIWIMMSYFQLFFNYPFFILGYLLMKNIDVMERIFVSRNFTVVSVVSCVLYVFYDKYGIHHIAIRWIAVGTCLFAVLYLFRSANWGFRTAWGGYFSRFLNYVGTHTLSIYVLHYFFLPKNMQYMNVFLAPKGVKDENIVLELMFCSIIATIVLVSSLTCGRLIEKNSLLSKILLGYAT